MACSKAADLGLLVARRLMKSITALDCIPRFCCRLLSPVCDYREMSMEREIEREGRKGTKTDREAEQADRDRYRLERQINEQ